MGVFVQRLSKNRDTFDVNKYLEMANQKDVISFAAGIASFENPPVRAFKGIEHELLSNPKGMLVSPVAGFSSLRKVMASYMQKRSCFCHPSEIMLVSGAQEGIDLAARAFLNPGDIVLIEEPSFFPAIQSFRSMGARLMAVPMEHDGMDVRILEQLLMRYHPKLIYTMPTYHNPCGVTMSTAKRVRLLELAAKYSVPVLEDDPYSELSFEGQTTAPLKSMDTNGNVIYLSSFPNHLSRASSGLDLCRQEIDPPFFRYPSAYRFTFLLYFTTDCGAFYCQWGDGKVCGIHTKGI